jgi:hypothetical protein
MRIEVAVVVCALWTGAGVSAHPAAPDVPVHGVALVGPAVQPTLIQVDLAKRPGARLWMPGDPVKDLEAEGEEGEEGDDYRAYADAPEPTARGEARAPWTPATLAGVDPSFGTLTRSFSGMGFMGGSPADPSGAVGPNHYVQAVNGFVEQTDGAWVAIFDKAGTELVPPFRLNSLATGGGCPGGYSDPVVLHDRQADRFVLAEITHGSVCVYVSRTPDPVAGGWFRYEFATPGLPDYAKLGAWSDAYYLSTNESLPAAYALERDAMLAGMPARTVRFTAPRLAGFALQALTPADLDGPLAPPPGTPGLFVRHRDDELHDAPGTAQDFIELWELRVDWTAPASSTFTGPRSIPVSDFDSRLCGANGLACVPQPSGTHPLDVLTPFVMWRLQYRNFGSYQALVGNLATDATGTDVAGIRWFELRKSVNPPGGWNLHQEGTHSDGATHRWMGSAALDGRGNLALAYSVSSPTVFPGLRYAGRLASAVPGTLPEGEHSIVEGADSSAINRWGDYASLSVDPADDCTFWFTGMHQPGPRWGTHVGAFRFEYCGVPDFAVVASPASLLAPPLSSLALSVTVSAVNGFASPVTLSAPAPPTGVSVSFYTNPLTPAGSHGAAATTATLTIAKTVPPGLYTVTIRGKSGALERDSFVRLRVTMPALYDAALRAPTCTIASSSCDSATMLVGRAALGPEPNQPNTIAGSCPDATGGIFHLDGSLDRLVVYSTETPILRTGRPARIEATVWSVGLGQYLDLYRANDASAPVWTYLTTLSAFSFGRQVLSTTYLPGPGGRQAIRGRFRVLGSPAPCGGGVRDDHDDLVFPVAVLP